MAQILGIDTSNYTTSAALLDLETGEVHQEKQLLPVKVGEVGLRQSDAVFHHTRQLPELLERLRPFLENNPVCGGIMSGKRELSKPMRATFFYYFLTYELNRDFREHLDSL